MPDDRPRHRVHYLRQVRGTQDRWVHCGRALAQVHATTILSGVTCRVCRRYIAKGLAYGYRPSAGLGLGDDHA